MNALAQLEPIWSDTALLLPAQGTHLHGRIAMTTSVPKLPPRRYAVTYQVQCSTPIGFGEVASFEPRR